MSHFCVFVIGEDIETHLMPFKETIYNKNSKWDWYQIGGRWTGFLTLKDGAKGKLGTSSPFDLKEPLTVKADIAYKKDIQDFENIKIPYAILHDGTWHARGEMGWFGVSADMDDDWETTARKILNDLPDDILITVVDCHI